MEYRVNHVSPYNPGNCTPELLEAILVDKDGLVEKLERSVEHGIMSGSKQSCLLIGPRGAGKTHILTVAYNRLKAKQELSNAVVFAYLKEEERGVACFLDWLVRILRSFQRWYPKNLVLDEGLQRLEAIPPEKAEKEARRLLLNFVGKKTLVVIVENLGDIFSKKKGMGVPGQQKFRDFIQEHPFWVLTGSAQVLSDDIRKGKAPFYGFFAVYHLRSFALEDAVKLLTRIATYEKKNYLVRFFESPRGRGRIRAIHEITGGSPRLLVTFYQFLNRKSLKEAADSFIEMTESLTPYYQERMNPRSAQQQKILEYLATAHAPRTVKQIASACFITQSVASSQLRILKKFRHIQPTSIGKETYYELSEPLFRICFEVKENKGYPVKLFVDFLGRFYTSEELKRKMETGLTLSNIFQKYSDVDKLMEVREELNYFRLALSGEAGKEEGLDFKEILKSVGKNTTFTPSKMVEKLISCHAFEDALSIVDSTLAYVPEDRDLLKKRVEIHMKLENWDKILEQVNLAIEANPDDAGGYATKGEALWRLGKEEEAVEFLEKALDLDESGKTAHRILGIIKRNEGLVEEALTHHKKAVVTDPNFALGWASLARTYEALKDFDDARHCFQKAVKLKPEDLVPWVYFGKFETAQGNFDKAEACFLEVIQIDPEDAEAWANIGLSQENLKKPEKARKSLEKAVQLDSGNVARWLALGSFEGRRGNHEKATECFQKLTTIEPDDAEGWRFLGFAQQNLKQFEEARISLEKAMQLDPGCTACGLALGRFEGGQGNYEKAVECFQKFTTIKPDYAEGWRLLGVAQGNFEQSEEARYSLEKAAQLDSGNADCWLVLGSFEGRQGNFEKGAEYFQKFTTIKPDYAEGWRLLGVAQLGLKQFEEARISIEKAVRIDSCDTYSWWVFGEVERNQGNHEKAAECFQKITTIKPDFAVGWRLLGLAQLSLKQFEEARFSLEKAVQLDSGNADCWLDLGRFEGSQGNREKALDIFYQGLKKCKPNSLYLNFIGETLRELKRFEEARKAYKKSIKLDDTHCYPHLNIALAFLEQGSWDEAEKVLTDMPEKAVQYKWNDDFVTGLTEINVVCFKTFESQKQLEHILTRQEGAYEKHENQETFYKGVSNGITDTLKNHRELEPGQLVRLHKVLSTLFPTVEILQVPLKFLDISVRYLEDQNPRILMELALEERNFLKGILGV